MAHGSGGEASSRCGEAEEVEDDEEEEGERGIAVDVEQDVHAVGAEEGGHGEDGGDHGDLGGEDHQPEEDFGAGVQVLCAGGGGVLPAVGPEDGDHGYAEGEE